MGRHNSAVLLNSRHCTISYLGARARRLRHWEIMVCPSNPSDIATGPGSSYLANAGWLGNERPHDPDDCGPTENIANGVFFDRTRGESDIRDLEPGCGSVAQDPIYIVSMATVQSKGDGATNTLMLSEGLSALYWTWVGRGVAEQEMGLRLLLGTA